MSLTWMELLIGGSVYYFFSVLFWLYPNLIHKPKQKRFDARHISHRGGSAEGYENTLRAFSHAVNCGTEMLELDVRLTKDKQVVVVHDENLLRLTGLSQLVCETDYENFRPIQNSVAIDNLPGECFHDASWTRGDRKIPLLIHVFSRFPKIPINVDLKTNDVELVRKVSDLIHAFKRQEITVWGSSDTKMSSLCYKIDPEIPRFFCTFKVIFIMMLALTGLLPFVSISETHFEVFLPLIIKRLIEKTKRKKLTNIENCALFHVPNLFIYARPLNFLTHLKARGIEVYFWVCNQEDEFEECMKVAASGIMTDCPTKLRNFFRVTKSQ